VNLTHSRYLAYVLLVLVEVCAWTYMAPMSTVSMSVIPPRLRAQSVGLQIFLGHVLGDVISPPFIGAFSDRFDLQTGMQIVWVMVLVAGFWWTLGAFCMPPLPLQGGAGEAPGPGGEGEAGDPRDEDELSEAPAASARATSFWAILCGPQAEGGKEEEEEDEEDGSSTADSAGAESD